jgi:ABC-2 type transport system permease protein
VLYVFFTKVAHVNNQAGASYHNYGVQLLGAIVLFTFLQEATIGAVRSVVDNEVLVRKIEFPRMVIPLAQVLLATFNLAGNLVVVLAFALLNGVDPMGSWIQVPVLIIFEAVLAAGLAMLLATAFVYFRDIQPIWEVVMQILFYASPVIITMATVAGPTGLSHGLVRLYMMNPMAVILQQFKHGFVNHAAAGASYYAGGNEWLLIPIGICIGLFVLGLWVFNRAAPRIADYL